MNLAFGCNNRNTIIIAHRIYSVSRKNDHREDLCNKNNKFVQNCAKIMNSNSECSDDIVAKFLNKKLKKCLLVMLSCMICTAF